MNYSDIDASQMTIGALIEQRAAELPHKEFLRFEGATISFKEAEAITRELASLLIAREVKPADRVCVLLQNGLAFPLVWLAIARIGAVMVPINIKYEREDIEHVLSECSPKAIITTENFVKKVQSAPTASSISLWLLEERSPWLLHADDYAVHSLPEVSSHDLVNIQYTSGTSGFPKGCMLTHEYFITLAIAAARIMEVRSSDVNITAQSFYYLDPQWNVILGLVAGIPLILLSRFSTSTFWKTVTEEEATIFYCIGAMPNMLLNTAISQYEKKHRLRVVYCSGINAASHATFEKRWHVPWREVFGMTETGFDLAVDIQDSGSVGTGCVGRPVQGKAATIRSDEDVELPEGEIGELCISGSAIMKGYWGNAEATLKTIKGKWLRTGDLAYRTSDQRFFLVGRSKDMIRRAGENIASGEVERAISKFPGISGVAVAPRAHQIYGEEVEAFILTEKPNLDPNQIIDYLSGLIAKFKHPRYITIVREIPYTASFRAEKYKMLANRSHYVVKSYDSVTKEWV